MEREQQRQLRDYRHRAAECARKALACQEPAIRRGFAEAARRWRKLAQRKEVGTGSEPARVVVLHP